MLNKHEKIQLINSNIDNYWRLIGRSSVIEIIEDDDLMLCQANPKLSRHEILNTVLRSSFNESNTMEKVLAVQSQFESRDQAFTWLVNEEQAPSNLKSTLFQSGFESVGKFDCKLLSLDEYQEQPVISPAEFRWAKSTHELEDWLIPQMAVKGLDEDSAKQYLKIRQDCLETSGEHYHFFVAYIDGKPIASGTLFIDNNVAGLFNGCTLPEARRRGIGTASVIFRLNYAKQLGCQYVIAETNRHMNSITTELGFETLLMFHELGYGLH
ncbi:MAG: GNAT family N-acetyltransferase [Coxiellaceae bacterium]|nr:GNAT family N-acetyltransferase [Coxiellaceae bacterium]